MDVGLVVGAAVLQHSAPSAVRYFSPGLVAPAGHQAFERVHDVNGKPAGTGISATSRRSMIGNAEVMTKQSEKRKNFIALIR